VAADRDDGIAVFVGEFDHALEFRAISVGAEIHLVWFEAMVKA